MTKLKVLQRLEVAVIKNKRIWKCLLMIVVSLLLILNFSIEVSASTNYDRQEADACITISERLSVKGGSGSNRTLITGDDWNNYFREKYGYDQVNWETAYDSPNDIIEMPSRVTDMNPNGLYNYLQAEKLNIEPLGQGVNKGISFSKGGGYNVHFNSKYGASYI